MPDLTSTVSRVTGPAALQVAGVTHDDIDLTMVYDSFTYTTLVTLEGLGFVDRARARTSWRGRGPPPAATSL